MPDLLRISAGTRWPTINRNTCRAREHLGHDKYQAEAGRESTNVRNGVRAKTVVSDAAGEVRIDVPQDREL
jgi:transposase-like protein